MSTPARPSPVPSEPGRATPDAGRASAGSSAGSSKGGKPGRALPLGKSPVLSALAVELGKLRPFDLPEEEAYLNLARTHSLLTSQFDHLFRDYGLTEATYNVLRILRGAAMSEAIRTGRPVPPDFDKGRAMHEISEHMVARVPDVTRLVDRLEREGHAVRRRCAKDRRVVYVMLTPQGFEVLAKLDEPVARLHQSQCRGMLREELTQLSALLVKARQCAQSCTPAPTPNTTTTTTITPTHATARNEHLH